MFSEGSWGLHTFFYRHKHIGNTENVMSPEAEVKREKLRGICEYRQSISRSDFRHGQQNDG